MNDRIEQIEARAEAATKGPWFQHQDWIDMGVPDASHTISDDPKPYGKFIASVGLNYAVKHGNANFIAHAREDVPYLLALVREQASKLEAIEGLCSDWDAVVDVFPLTPAALFAGSHAKRVRAALTAGQPETGS